MIAPDETGPFRSVPFVADRIGWHERTLRRRCVAVTAWLDGYRKSGLDVVSYTIESNSIPAMRLGAMWRIPVWWMTAVVETAKTPTAP
jgi:hypothetical protein